MKYKPNPEKRAGKMRIDGTGSSETMHLKTTLSKRAVSGKLIIEKGKCPRCYHHKKFIGNIEGIGRNRCSRCGHEL